MTQAKFLTMLQLQWNDLGKDGRMNYGKKKYCRFEAIDYVVAATIYASRDAFKNGIYDYDTNCSFAESRSAQCTLVDD